MDTTTSKQTHPGGAEKKAYSTPRLVEYGSLSQLTQGSTKRGG